MSTDSSGTTDRPPVTFRASVALARVNAALENIDAGHHVRAYHIVEGLRDVLEPIVHGQFAEPEGIVVDERIPQGRPLRLSPGESLSATSMPYKLTALPHGRWALSFTTEVPQTRWERWRDKQRLTTAQLELSSAQVEHLRWATVCGRDITYEAASALVNDHSENPKSALGAAVRAARGGDPPGPTYGYA